MISLKNLVREACPDDPSLASLPDAAVRGLTCDSRKIEKGFLFVAIRGTRQNGRDFIPDAIRRGAVAVVTEEEPSADAMPVPIIRVPDSRLAAANLAGVFYAHPSRRMKLVGVTGTNGKTTSCYLIEHLLRCEQEEVGVIGTVNYRFAGQTMPAVETTPGPIRLQDLISRMRGRGCRLAVMEVSAHAMDQRRVEGLCFHTVLFTNLTQDHLDYFQTLDRYFECKARLLTSLSPEQWAVLNADDIRVRTLAEKTKARVLTFGVDAPADLRADAIEQNLKRTCFRLCSARGVHPVEIPLTGLHNVYNTLGALATAQSLGFEPAAVAPHLTSFGGVPGRLERVERGQSFTVFIDYAHTPDGLENVLGSLRPHKKGRLITLFGCGGDRDRGKRPQMAKIASDYSDFVVVTSDNPRSENPRAIANEICAGFPAGFKRYVTTLDRRKAIRQALLMAGGEDIVVLAGKGHETTQVIGDEAFLFSDREEAERVLDGR